MRCHSSLRRRSRSGLARVYNVFVAQDAHGAIATAIQFSTTVYTTSRSARRTTQFVFLSVGDRRIACGDLVENMRMEKLEPSPEC